VDANAGTAAGYVNDVALSPSSVGTVGTPASTPLRLGIAKTATTDVAEWDGYLNYAYLWNRVLPIDQIVALKGDPWQILKPVVRRSYFIIPTGGGVTDYPTYPDAGALSFTGFAPTLALGIALGVGALTLEGQAPTVTQQHFTSPDTAACTITGYEPTVSQQYYVAPDAGALTLEGQEPTLGRTYQVTPDAGALTFEGQAPSIPTDDVEVYPDAGALTFTGYVPTIDRDHTTEVPVGTLTLTGYAPTLSKFTIEIRQGAVVKKSWEEVLTGTLTTYTKTLSAGEVASITDWSAVRYAFIANGARVEVTWAELETPPSSSFWYAYPTTGSLTFTGYPPTILLGADKAVAPGTGTLTFTGYAPTLDLGSYTVPVPQGTLTLTGFAPTLDLGNRTVEVPTGTLTLTGQVPVVPSFTLALWQGSTVIATWIWHPPTTFTTATYDIPAAQVANITDWSRLRYAVVADGQRHEVSWLELEAPAEIPANPTPGIADLTLTGYSPDVFVTGAKVPGVGSLTFTGYAPELIGPGTVAPGCGTLSFTGYAPTLDTPHIVYPGVGTLTLTGYVPPQSKLELYQGSTLITSRALLLTDDYANYNFTLTATEKAAVTNWAALRVKIVADGVQAVVSWLEIAKTYGTFEPPTGTLTFVGYAPTVTHTKSISVPTGTLTLTGLAPAIPAIEPDTAALTLTGYAPSLALVLSVPTGTLTLTGYAPIPIGQNPTIEVPTGTLTFEGFAPMPPPKAYVWTDRSLVASGEMGGTLVAAKVEPRSIVSAGIAGEDLEYD